LAAGVYNGTIAVGAAGATNTPQNIVVALTLSSPPGQQPTATTGAATNITATSATLNSTVNSNGSDTTEYYQYGTTTAYGGSSGTQDIGAAPSPVSFPFTLNNLTCNTAYHFRIVAQNTYGTSNGSDASFTTSACATAPATPTGLSPGGSSQPGTTVTTLTPTLTWSASSGATQYTVAVLNVSSGATVFTQTVSTTSVTTSTLQNGVTYIWDVGASNSAGSSSPSLGVYFTTRVAPIITGITPNPVPGLNGDQTITIQGTSFVSGATVTLTSLGQTFPIPASRTTFVNSSQIQISANVTTTAASWTAQVTNPSLQASNVFTFTVN
jgi:hypothetical protein